MKHTSPSIKKMIATRRRNAKKRVRLEAKRLLGERALHTPAAVRGEVTITQPTTSTFTGPVTIQVSS